MWGAYASFTMVPPKPACVFARASISSLPSCFRFLQSCMQHQQRYLSGVSAACQEVLWMTQCGHARCLPKTSVRRGGSPSSSASGARDSRWCTPGRDGGWDARAVRLCGERVRPRRGRAGPPDTFEFSPRGGRSTWVGCPRRGHPTRLDTPPVEAAPAPAGSAALFTVPACIAMRATPRARRLLPRSGAKSHRN